MQLSHKYIAWILPFLTIKLEFYFILFFPLQVILNIDPNEKGYKTFSIEFYVD